MDSSSLKRNEFLTLKCTVMRVKKISQRSIGLLRRKPSAKQKNLENKRGLFLQIGLIISLSIVFLAFEWTTVRTNKIDRNNLGRGEIIEELAEVSFHKKKIEMPKPKIIQTIEIVSDEIDTDDDLEISIENTDETVNDLDLIIEDDPDETIEERVIFYSAEKQPEFPGGLSAMRKFLSDNLVYPGSAKEVGITGTVHIEFVVWNDGSIRKVKVLRGIGGGCDEEAVRVIKSMPDWYPGVQRTTPVNILMAIQISFHLSN